MRAIRVVVGTGLLTVMAACSAPGTSTSTSTSKPTATSSSGSTGSGARAGSSGSGSTTTTSSNTVFRFQGTVDVTKKTIDFVVRSPSGALQTETTLPYGTGAGEAYFHTCSTPAVTYTPSGAGGALTGLVQAVNNVGSTVTNLTIVMNSISDPGTFFTTSLTSGDYGTVTSGLPADCGQNTATWTFTQNTTTNFSFTGEADGTLPGATECTTTPAVVASVTTAAAIATDGTNVYWSDINAGSGSILSRSVNGGTTNTFITGVAPLDLAIDGSNLYAGDTNNGNVYSIPLGSPALNNLATDSAGFSWGIAVSGSSVYYSDSSATIFMVPATTYVTGGTSSAALGMGAFGGLTYVADDGDHAIYAYDSTGALQAGDTITLAAGTSPQDVAVDATGVYWTDAANNVMMQPAGGGSPVTLASGQSTPQGIALDSNCVYWANNTGGTYMKVSK